MHRVSTEAIVRRATQIDLYKRTYFPERLATGLVRGYLNERQLRVRSPNG